MDEQQKSVAAVQPPTISAGEPETPPTVKPHVPTHSRTVDGVETPYDPNEVCCK